MPHPKKKQRLDVMKTELAEASAAEVAVSAGDLSIDVLANIFGYLDGPKDIMQKRRVCKKWKEAVKMTTSPLVEFHVDSMENYNVMTVMTRAMPNLQQITLTSLGIGHVYNDGEDPDERQAARNAYRRPHDIESISNFSKLRILKINYAAFNGRYPFLFNSFPLLQKLSIEHSGHLKWDLDMLSGLPLLKELICNGNEFNSSNDNIYRPNSCMTGSINSLRLLKESLDVVHIEFCRKVEGNFMDLADFSHLKVLYLPQTAVTGDIRDIGENDFSSLEELMLPTGVYGGRGYQIQRISDAPDVIRAVYLLKKQRGMECYRKILLIATSLIGSKMKLKMTIQHSTFALFKRDHALDIDGKLSMKTLVAK
jgi:hypothetical protein